MWMAFTNQKISVFSKREHFWYNICHKMEERLRQNPLQEETLVQMAMVYGMWFFLTKREQKNVHRVCNTAICVSVLLLDPFVLQAVGSDCPSMVS